MPVTFDRLDDKCRRTGTPLRGTVVWIHLKKRFHVVEFDTPGGRIRESFQGV